MKTVVGITIVGKDREGIVAAFTNFVFQSQGNVEQINQNVIKGLFGMYLEASFARVNRKKFDSDLADLARKYGVEADTYHESSSKKNIAIFVTREPHCLEILLKNKSKLKGNIAVIVGTQATLEPLAKSAKIPFVLVSDSSQEKAETRLIQICKKYGVDLIVLARYMRILSPNFVWRYPHRIINIHPSLLPAFPGAFAYAQAFERGTKIVGVTSHYVTENLDQGPIIFQDSFTVRDNDTLEKIKEKGRRLEEVTLLRATKNHLENRLDVNWRKVHVKSKRVP